MSKNILVFSDGTGQAGGLRPDQRLSNIYKLYRATRPGSGTQIDPLKQIAYYDAGLGSEAEDAQERSKTIRNLKQVISMATGIGITNNITDCYEYIIQHYEPGDRIYLFGFSRGAYTIRCVASVLTLCGIPLYLENGDVIPRYGKQTRKVAEEAVNKVYNHGAGKDRGDYRDERQEQARRFRNKYGSSNTQGAANAVPHFIGAFETVAALGAAWLVWTLIGAAGALAIFGILTVLSPLLDFEVLYTIFVILSAGFALYLFRAFWGRVKFIGNYPKKGCLKWHISSWGNRYYDQKLDERVGYVRHALAIDENRKSFKRVDWNLDDIPKSKLEGNWFKQVWFAGNHSDIGGSYPEVESRLSDVSLAWMIEELVAINNPPNILIDSRQLSTFPDPKGMQHSEIEFRKDKRPNILPKWFPWLGWKRAIREIDSTADKHPTVEQRFKANVVQHYGIRKPYRPESLKNDPHLSKYYDV